MMKINLLFFGITTDLVGKNQLEIEVSESTTVAECKAYLKEHFPQLQHINTYAIAVNEEYAEDNVVLKQNDVVAVIPPVSGG